MSGRYGEAARVRRTFGPFFRPDSELLILGSFPSVRSREQGSYYGHPQNRFWRVLAALFGDMLPSTREQKERMLAARRIALWDVVQECSIVGSSDSSLRDVLPCDLPRVTSAAPIRLIALNGSTAARLYERIWHDGMPPHVRLPSTSPANAAWSLERLIDAWGAALLPADGMIMSGGR